MAAYLIDHPPVRDQWYVKRNRPLTGCTVLHTAEGVLDTIGPDTGAETTAEFIRTRTTAGSYHDLVDSDSWVQLIPYEHGAYHDGTGSNNWALSISFACRTSDWRAMSPEKRAGFLRQGARAFAAQQAWRRAHGFPTTELRLISKAQSDAGMSGFTYHGLRDPGRRTDPGVLAPNLFPFDEFVTYCRAALAGNLEEDDDVSYDADKANLYATLANIRNQLASHVSGVSAAAVALTEKRFAELRASEAATSAVLQQAAAKPGSPIDLEAVKAAAREGAALANQELVDVVRPLLAEAVQEGMAADNAATADEIVDRLASRLAGRSS